MKQAILFTTSTYNSNIVNYIIELGQEYNIDFKVLNTLEEVNNSNIQYVVTRGIPRDTILQMKNKYWYNDLELTKLVADKYETKEVLIEKGMSKYVIKSFSEMPKEEDFPVILKDNTGSKGSNIFLCYSVEEIENIREENSDVDFIIEEYIGENKGVATDYRVYLVNFEPKIFIKRTNEGITSNVSQGGKVEIVEPMFEKELIEINKAVPLNVTAIDFTMDAEGNLKIFEMNASPGVKALYENDIDAYRPFMEWYSGYIK